MSATGNRPGHARHAPARAAQALVPARQDTPTVHFRKLVDEITLLLTYEATRTSRPRTSRSRRRWSGRPAADLGQEGRGLPGAARGRRHARRRAPLIPSARVGFIGLYRDEETLQPVEYYLKLPDDLAERDAIVLDPMLATGDSSAAAIEVVKDAGARR